MHAISSYRGNRPTNKETNKRTETGAITIHCAAASLARNVNILYYAEAACNQKMRQRLYVEEQCPGWAHADRRAQTARGRRLVAPIQHTHDYQ